MKADELQQFVGADIYLNVIGKKNASLISIGKLLTVTSGSIFITVLPKNSVNVYYVPIDYVQEVGLFVEPTFDNFEGFDCFINYRYNPTHTSPYTWSPVPSKTAKGQVKSVTEDSILVSNNQDGDITIFKEDIYRITKLMSPDQYYEGLELL
jgi:hypothetical protein